MGEVDVAPRGIAEPGAGVGLETGIDWEASLFASLITTALLEKSLEKELVLEAASIFQEAILPELVGLVDGSAASLIEGPVVDIVELVDCVGGDTVGEALYWAYSILVGKNVENEPENLGIIADCLGWAEDPENLPPSLKASLLIASLIASLNKYLASIA